MAGNWSFRGSSAEYRSPRDASSPVGVALSSAAALRNGHVAARIRLNDASNAGRVLLGYHAATGGYFAAGIGGDGYAYTLEEFVPGQGMRALKRAGDGTQLDPAASYEVDVELRGQSVTLAVDGIRVIDHTLPYPPGGYQAGLAARGPGPVQFDEVRAAGTPPRAFVVMQFTEPYDSLYQEVIRPVCERGGFEVQRADDVFRPGIILRDILSGLLESDVVIAEISPVNANVFYELGYAHALEKPTVLLARRNGELPFDLSGYRVIFYDDTIRGKPEVEATLEKHLANISRGRGA